MSSLTSTGPLAVLAAQPWAQLPSALELPKNAEQKISALPSSFPATLESKLAWTGADFESASTFVCELTEADKVEIAAGLAHFRGKWPCS